MPSSRQIDLKSIKRQAHRLAKQNHISKGEALELLASNSGFPSWQEYRAYILNSGVSSKEKVHAIEFNPTLHSHNQIRGLYPEENRLQVRISYLSAFSDSFINIDQLRSYFDCKFKEIIANSKDHTLIFVLLNLNISKDYPFTDEEGFFNSLLKQYPKISNLQIRYSSAPPSIEDIQAWHEETHLLIDSILGKFL